MTNNLIHYVSTAEKFLLSSTKFWSTLSTAAAVAALSSFYSTQQHTNSFNDSGKYVCSFIIVLHLIIFLSDPQKLKNTFAPFFLGSGKKWALRITAMTAVYALHYVPEQSVVGLIFVIFVWIDVIAITRIIKPSIDLWITNSLFLAVLGRSNYLYGFTAHYWLIMLLCFPVIYMRIRLDGYKDEETKEKEG
ncbi:hypothetical protein L1887_05151 [Cichorium endivia]|nr:hypothetical protein L1887_05151 [Cichorium endivia]